MTLHHLRVLATAAALSAWLTFALASPAYADAIPDPAPDGSLPGGRLIAQMLGWLKYGAIASAVAGLLGGGIAIGIGHFGSNYNASAAGRKWLLGGIGAAMVAGLAHTIALTVYTAS
jgi:hypothetical protein